MTTNPSHPNPGLPGINVLADPQATEAAGRRIAEQAVALHPGCVVIWDDPQSAVLAHIVSRELGCSTARAFEYEGLIDLIDVPEKGTRGLLVAESFATTMSVQALVGVARNQGITVVGIAALIHSEALGSAEESMPIIVADGSENPQ